MKSLFIGIFFIILFGVGGLLYRNALERPTQQVACPVDAKVCPDGTSVSRTGLSCTFPTCPPPNVSMPDIGITFALPEGYVADEHAAGADPSLVGTFVSPSIDSVTTTLLIRTYPIAASSTAIDTIRATAIQNPSGQPAPATAFTSVVLGNHRFTEVQITRFEGIVDTAYYLARENDILRFDAIDTGVTNWTDSQLDTSTLPGNVALRGMIATLQGQ